MEKLENEYLYAQLSFALKDLKTEVDGIREPFGGLQTSIHESLQLLRIEFESFEVVNILELNFLFHLLIIVHFTGRSVETKKLNSSFHVAS